MFKKSAVEKRLRKISKQEALNVKLLEKQVRLSREEVSQYSVRSARSWS